MTGGGHGPGGELVSAPPGLCYSCLPPRALWPRPAVDNRSGCYRDVRGWSVSHLGRSGRDKAGGDDELEEEAGEAGRALEVVKWFGRNQVESDRDGQCPAGCGLVPPVRPPSAR